jgi:hypothetical protein
MLEKKKPDPLKLSSCRALRRFMVGFIKKKGGGCSDPEPNMKV